MDLINYKLIEDNKLECIHNWCDLFGKHSQNSQISRRMPLEKDPITRIINRFKNWIYWNWQNFNCDLISDFRLKSYDDPLRGPDFVLRLSDIQTVHSSILYRHDHLLNIIKLNIKQIIEFNEWVFFFFFYKFAFFIY